MKEQIVVKVEASVKRAIRAAAKKEGVSMNKFCETILARAVQKTPAKKAE